MGVASTTVTDNSRLFTLQQSSSYDAQSSLQWFYEPEFTASRTLLVVSHMSLTFARCTSRA
jgi:hypothetical protein